MFLKNFKIGYVPFFEKEIGGTIHVSRREWKRIVDHLTKVRTGYHWDKTQLLEDIDIGMKVKYGTAYCLGKKATRLIVWKFMLYEYEDARNYRFLVKLK